MVEPCESVARKPFARRNVAPKTSALGLRARLILNIRMYVYLLYWSAEIKVKHLDREGVRKRASKTSSGLPSSRALFVC